MTGTFNNNCSFNYFRPPDTSVMNVQQNGTPQNTAMFNSIRIKSRVAYFFL